MREKPILWISPVSNRCQPAPIKEESTSLKQCSFIRPQLCAALMVIIASKVAPQFSRDPIWKLSQLNLWVLRWMSLISDLIFNYVLTHCSMIFIMTCREWSFPLCPVTAPSVPLWSGKRRVGCVQESESMVCQRVWVLCVWLELLHVWSMCYTHVLHVWSVPVRGEYLMLLLFTNIITRWLSRAHQFPVYWRGGT